MAEDTKEGTPEDLIDILGFNLAAKRDAEEWKLRDNQYKAPFAVASLSGFRDPNRLINPEDLTGDVYDSGIFYEMRQADPIISSIMDFRRDSVGSLDYEIVPRCDEPTLPQQMAAKAVDWYLRNIPYMGLKEFISHAYDEVFSYGFALYEMHIPEEGPDAGKLCLYHIPSFQTDWFNLDKETRTRLESVRIDTGDGLKTIDARKLVWFGDMQYPGNFWGKSDLRKVMSTFTAKKQDLQSYLALRRLQQGILYFKENGEYPNNAASWQVAKSYFTQYFQGKPSPLILNAGMDLEYLNVTIPGVDNYSATASYFDAIIRESLGASLKNLGIGGNSGAYALGKELAISDADQFTAHVEDFLMMLNGANAPESNLLQVITDLCGFDARTDTPQIIVRNNVEHDISESIEKLVQLFAAGIMEKKDLPEDLVNRLLKELGLADESEMGIIE